MSTFRGQVRESVQQLAESLRGSEIQAITFEAGSWDEYVSADEMVEHAAAVAEQLIEAFGFDLNDSDAAGDYMGKTVLDALTFVVLRVGASNVEKVL
jgi:hypothetical protein